MKNNWIRILGTAVAVLLAVAVFQPTLASCGNARLVSTFDGAVASFVYTPGACVAGGPFPCGAGPAYASVTGALSGAFWGMGVGDPALLNGADNGSFDVGTYGAYIAPYLGWMTGNFYYPTTFVTDWSQAGIDGCIDAAVPTGTKCTAVLLSDTIGDEGYFAFLTAEANANQNYIYTRPGGAAITLAKVPKVAITGSSRISSTQVSVTVDPPFGVGPGTAQGFYLDGSCNSVGTPTGWRVHQRTVAGHGGAAPSGRDVASWGTALNVDQVFDGLGDTVTGSCVGEEDIYLAYSIAFDSGYELTFVGDNSTRVECGENLADPGDRPTQLEIQSDRFRRKPSSGRRGR